MSWESWGHADHTDGECRCLSSDSTGAYVHGLSLAVGGGGGGGFAYGGKRGPVCRCRWDGAQMDLLSGVGARPQRIKIRATPTFLVCLSSRVKCTQHLICGRSLTFMLCSLYPVYLGCRAGTSGLTILIHYPACPDIPEVNDKDMSSEVSDGPMAVRPPPPGFEPFSWLLAIGRGGDLRVLSLVGGWPGRARFYWSAHRRLCAALVMAVLSGIRHIAHRITPRRLGSLVFRCIILGS